MPWQRDPIVPSEGKILLVDDEPQILRALAINLKALGYQIDAAQTGEQALQRAAAHRPDAVILDLGLPGIDGIDVIRGLRGWSDVPIIVLTVREAERDKIQALDAGADDYVTKPFGMGELLARLRAALRRATPDDVDQPVLTTLHFTIDLQAKKVVDVNLDEIRLTPTEWGIVEVLVRNQGKLISQTKLLHDVWGPQYGEETNYLRVFMAQVRRKLEPDPGAPRYFITEPGMGYRFENPGSEDPTTEPRVGSVP
jgi:two-component system KDP operon response regulator KdpE